MLEISEARGAARRELERANQPDRPTDDAPADCSADMYPWGWSPPPPHHVSRPTLRDTGRHGGKVTRWIPPREAHVLRDGHVEYCSPKGLWFPYGATLFKALMWWLGKLQWPRADSPCASDGITFAELALDFEVSTGINLPPTQRALGLAGFAKYKSAAQRLEGRDKAGVHSIAADPTTASRDTHALWDSWVRAGVVDDGAQQLHIARSLHHRAQ
eukprot:gene7270-5599_t